MIKIKKFSESGKNEWDLFIDSSNNGTIFHLRRFLSYHPKGRFADHSLLAYKKGKLIGVIPAAIKKINDKSLFVSHPGLSVGSFIVQENLSISDSLLLIKTFINYVSECGFDGIRVTLSPIIYQKRLSNYIEFSFIKYGFKYVKRELSSVLFLEKNLELNLKKFRPSHLRAVRSALKKNIEVKKSNDYNTFYTLLEKNLLLRHNVYPTHSLDELKKLVKLFPDRINLFSANIEDKMIAGVVNFILNKNTVLAFYICHDNSYKEYKPVTLLFYNIIDWAIKQKYSTYDFGLFTIHETPNMGLGRFKENFGASGVFRDTIEIIF